MSTLVALALLAAGIGLVVAGAEALLDGLLGAARGLRISAFALTALLSGFELENLGAGIAANAKGLPGAAAGTVLGGTTFLALGVAGATGLIAPVRAELPRAVLAWTAAAPVPLLGLSLDGELSRFDGAVLLAWFALAMAGLARAGRSIVVPETDEAPKRFVALRVVAGLALVGLGGELLGEGIRRVVSRLGVSATLLGNTAVAAAVEAEEIGRVVVPARRGRGDVALGNVVGTIVHFVAFNAGVLALVKPLALDRASLGLHLPVAVGASVLLCGVLGARGGIGRVEGALLVALYASYVAAAIVVGLR